MQALGDIIPEALSDFLRALFEPIEQVIQNEGSDLVETIVSTPAPDSVFEAPTNGAWPQIYEYYWEGLIPLVLFLYGLSIALVIFFESTNHLFSSYHQTKLKRRAFSGLLGILSWWWISAFSLRLVDGLGRFLAPDLATVTLFEVTSFSVIGLLGLLLSLTVDLVLFVLIALIYFTRHVMLYLFVLLMPLLIVFWIPGVGPFSLVSRFMQRLAGFYAPFLFMTIPVALLFRLGALLGESFAFSQDGIMAWVVALIIPFVAVVSPLLLFWQAGAIFVFGERAGHHTSGRTARNRVQSARQGAQTTAHGGQNFARGVRGDAAVKRDGQTVLGSGDSQAHSAGSRLRETSVSLRERIAERTGNSTGPNAATDGSASTSPTESESTSSTSGNGSTDDSRAGDFSTLRDRSDDDTSQTDGNDDENGTYDPDDRPRYIN